MNINIILGALLVVLLATPAIAQSPLSFIPRDAYMVGELDFPHFERKADIDAIMQLGVMRMMTREMERNMGGSGGDMSTPQQMLANFGVDLNRKMYMYVAPAKVNRKRVMTIGFVVPVQDGAKLMDFRRSTANQASRDKYPAKTMGTLKYFADADGFFALGSEYALIGAVEVPYGLERNPDFDADPVLQFDIDMEDGNRQQAAAAKAIPMLLKLDRSNTIQVNTQYSAANVGTHDLKLWVDQAFAGDLQGMMSGSSSGYVDPTQKVMQDALMKLYENSSTSMGLNFNQGNIRLNVNNLMNPVVADAAEEMFDTKLNKRFMKYLPENTLMYFSMALDPEGTVEGFDKIGNTLLKDTPFKQYYQPTVDLLDIFLDEDEIYDLWTGSVVVALTGVNNQEITYMTYEYDEDFNRIEVEKTSRQPVPNILVMLSYGDEENTKKFMKLGLSSGFLKQEGLNRYSVQQIPDMPAGIDLYVGLHKGVMIVTNDRDLVMTRLETGVTARLAKDQQKLLRKNSSVLRVNVPELYQAVADAAGPMLPSDPQMTNIGKQTIRTITVKTGNVVNDRALPSTYEVEFFDQNTNALQVLLQLADSIMGGSGSNM